MKLNLTKPLIVFDLETTGLDMIKDRIIQISYIKVMPDGTEDRKNLFVNPCKEIPAEVVALTGISNEDVKDAPTFPDVWKEIGPYFKSSLLIAHNTPFDLAVLDKTLLYYKIPFDVANFLDTKEKASELHDIEDCKLDTLCSYFGVELLHHHDALADTRACREIYKGLKDKVGWRESDVKVKWFGQCHLKMDSNSITTSMKVLEGIR